jgi:hypothetical protein
MFTDSGALARAARCCAQRHIARRISTSLALAALRCMANAVAASAASAWLSA